MRNAFGRNKAVCVGCTSQAGRQDRLRLGPDKDHTIPTVVLCLVRQRTIRPNFARAIDVRRSHRTNLIRPATGQRKQLLDRAGIKDVVVCGAMSHMCVDPAVRAASDFGYRCTVNLTELPSACLFLVDDVGKHPVNGND